MSLIPSSVFQLVFQSVSRLLSYLFSQWWFRSLIGATLFGLFFFGQGQLEDRRYNQSEKPWLSLLTESGSVQWGLEFPKTQATFPNDPVQLAQSLYYYVAGPPATGYPGGFVGPEQGLFGIIDGILGHPSVQESFVINGFGSCEELPEFGSVAISGHPLGALEFMFSPGRQRVPGHFTTAPHSTLAKRIDILRDGLFMMTLEMSCDQGEGVASGFILINDERHMEIHYQLDRVGTRRQVDVYMDFPRSRGNSFDERFVMRFDSADGEDFRIWSVRNAQNIDEDMTTPDSNSVGVAIHGNTRLRRAQVELVTDTSGEPDDVTPVHEGQPYCLDLSTGSSSPGTTACGPELAITAAVPGVKGEGFTIGETQAVVLEETDVLLASRFIHEFFDVASGREGRQLITLTNVGTQRISNLVPRPLASPFAFTGGSFPGRAGSCGSVIEQGETCVIDVAFQPSGAGSFTNVLELDYDFGGEVRTLSVELLGTTSGAQPTGLLTLINANPFSFGSLPVGGSLLASFTVENRGQWEASNLSGASLSAPFQYAGGVFPGTGGTCGAILAPGAFCEVVISFRPTAAGLFNSSAQITYDNGLGPAALDFDLEGSGTSVALLSFVDPGPVDFGMVTVGASTNQVISLSNGGGSFAFFLSGELGDPTGASPFTFVGGTYPGVGGTCARSLAPGDSCDLVLNFAPQSLDSFVESLTLSYSANGTSTSDETLSLSLEGQGGAPAQLVISGVDPIDVGNTTIGGAVPQILTVTNSGGVSASSLSGGFSPPLPFQFSGGAFPGINGSCGSELDVANSCEVEVEFRPTTSGVFTGQLAISYNDGLSTQVVTRFLQGNAGTNALLTIVQPEPVDFGTMVVGGTGTQTLEILNQGGGVATGLNGQVSIPFSFTGGAFPGIGGTCAASLAASASCSVVIQAAPTTTGLASETLTLDYNDGVVAQTLSHALTVTGVAPASLAFTGANSYSFGSVVVGSVSTHTFDLVNLGGFQATSLFGGSLVGAFSYTGGAYPGINGTCFTVLAAGQSCTIEVQAEPALTGIETGTLVVNYIDGLGPQVAEVSLMVTGALP